MLPLQQFVCDTCKGLINQPSDGWLEFHFNEDTKSPSVCYEKFAIVHVRKLSPLEDRYCESEHSCKISLNDILQNNSEDAMATLLPFLDEGEFHQTIYRGSLAKNMREFVEIMRRLTIKYYEEARLYMNDEDLNGQPPSGSNSSFNLQSIINKHKSK
jgi:hypothetical protein